MMAALLSSAASESPLFLLRPQQEREEIWQMYNEVVRAYMHHCGYFLATEQAA